MNQIISFILLSVFLTSCSNKVETSNAKEVQAEQEIIAVEQKLGEALKQEDISTILELMQKGMSPDIDFEGEPLLITAAIKEWDELVITLVNNGADIYCKAKEGKGNTFISLAASQLQEKTLFYILDNGFDIMRLSNKEIKDTFVAAISSGKINFQKRLIRINGVVEKLQSDNQLIAYFMYYWVDGTGGILETLLEKGFVVSDGALYYHAVTENSYKGVEWLIAHNFSLSELYDGETIGYWADLNLRRKRKTYDDSDPLPEDSPIVINAKKIKAVIDEHTMPSTD